MMRELGHMIMMAVLARLASLQVHHAGRRVQKPRVRVPLIDGRSKPPVGLGEPFHSGHGLRAREHRGDFRFITFCSCLAANPARTIEGA
jgi:hypothetical protein